MSALPPKADIGTVRHSDSGSLAMLAAIRRASIAHQQRGRHGLSRRPCRFPILAPWRSWDASFTAALGGQHRAVMTLGAWSMTQARRVLLFATNGRRRVIVEWMSLRLPSFSRRKVVQETP